MPNWLERWEGTKGVQINKDSILPQNLVIYSASAVVLFVCYADVVLKTLT